jgi:hypothetical protein
MPPCYHAIMLSCYHADPWYHRPTNKWTIATATVNTRRHCQGKRLL